MAKQLPQVMKGLGLEAAATRDVTGAPTVGMAGACHEERGCDTSRCTAWHGPPHSIWPAGITLGLLMCIPSLAGGGAAAPMEEAGDEDVEEFDRGMLGQSEEAVAGADERALPPCCKAQHAAGRRLHYHLHYSLMVAESSFAGFGPGAVTIRAA